MNNQWRKLAVSYKELNLALTLLGGQSFRWIKVDEEIFLGVFANIVWRLKQNDEFLFYQVEGELKTEHDESFSKMKLNWKSIPLNKNSTESTVYDVSYYENLLKIYFRLDENLEDLYKQWEHAHDHFKENSSKFTGIRVLNQAPIENIISFICSQNNNIKRISSMVSKFCELFGKRIKQVEGINYYTFPNVEELQDPKMEQKLREASFGYRAKYIATCVKQIKEKGGLNWFGELESMSYVMAHKQLLSISGIGPKVADCICLMSLNHLKAIPVDTHVYQIAKKHYLPNIQSTKTVTRKIYEQIGDTFRNVYGDYAGWAQTVLFCTDLKQFKDVSVECSQKVKKIKVKR